ncbi:MULTISPECIES: TetR/AcrR family transcriptional regulator [Achromobacter]|uniref:TetR/AcrR family transcriptional regulator n=1 Tax=Achromobacter TaxID=222 RepID=UPI0007C76B91|nr:MULTISPECIES: TetR/AcrR family transcriptional regulator [Achromobacter]MCP1403599.1 AcrR family transcriptional regulator [Achromobacter insolitus]MEB3096744.1 TetR/AcrR family transcriptional regulator [Achromobacter sp. D10]OAE69901.1 TetR family transcriptional regulator [Achromobacter insolitus]OCZ62106.1 TetR family transcriptional regulator [Achromobacter insolitus]
MDSSPSLQSESATPETGRRERKRQQTLDHLAQTAWRLFETLGYDVVTMEQIAAQADVSKGTLYNHFPVKEALLAHRFHGELAASIHDLQPALQSLPTLARRLTRILHASAHWSESHRAYLGPYLRYRLTTLQPGAHDDGRYPRSGMQTLFTALIADAQAAGQARTDLAADQLAHQLQFLYLGAMLRWLDLPRASLKAEFDAAVSLFVHGVDPGAAA